MKASGQNPIMHSEIAEEIDRLNATILDMPLTQSPRTPVSRNMEIIPQQQPNMQKQKMKLKQLSSIPFEKLENESPTRIQIEEMSNISSSKAPLLEKPD